MLRSISKTCFAAAYTLATAPKTAVADPFITCYHRVVENFEYSKRNAIPSMLISVRMLERHVDWLAKRFSIVSLDEMADHFQFGRAFPRPPAAITFDDGYADVYHHAYPLLMRKGIPFAAFVVTDLIGTDRPQIFDRLYLMLRLSDSRGTRPAQVVSAALESLGLQPPHLNGPAQDECFRAMTILLTTLPKDAVEELIEALERSISFDKRALREFAPLTWSMIETMQRNGVTIGSHTKSHALLTSETLETARRELSESKQTLEMKLGVPARHFAYPDGRFNPPVVEAVKSAGYQFAYCSCRRADHNLPLLTIPRKVLWENSCINTLGRFSWSIMHCQTNWVFDQKDRCEHDHSIVR